MRSLRVRTVLVVTLAALVPLVSVGAWARATLLGRAHDEHSRTLAWIVTTTQRQITRDLEDQARSLERLCTRDFVVDRLVLDVATGRFDAARQDELVELLAPLMRSLRLDVLEILNAGGVQSANRARVLGSGHYPGRSGATDPTLLGAAERAGARPFVADIRVQSTTTIETVATVLSSCSVDRHDVRLRLVGGRFLDAWAAAPPTGTAPTDRVELRRGAERLAGNEELIHEFRDADGVPAALLVAQMDESPLQAQLAVLDRGLLYSGTLAAIAALLVGGILGWSVSRPLSLLEAAARRVALGDLDSTFGAQADGEVGRALAAFDRMTRDLKATRRRLLRAERVAAWREIARRIAHEIKNPLSPIQVSIETMRKTYAKQHPDFPEIFEESTRTILEEVGRLKTIVSEFSQFARMPRPRPIEFDVEELLAHVVLLHRGSPGTVRLERSGVPHIVNADREQLTQVFVNLVQNAMDAARAHRGEEGGEVVVGIEADTEREGTRVTVDDNGPGIALDARERIFEPYYTTKASGTGLGLAIAHRIIEEHKGDISIDASPSGGARVRVWLPRQAIGDGPLHKDDPARIQ